MIKQQVGLTRTFNDSIRRITVLIRAADLLWPYEQKRARATFAEAFELAVEKEKENDEKGPASVVLRIQTPDQRYIVIRAIVRRDPTWARELTRQMLKLNTQGRESSRDTDSRESSREASRDTSNDLLAAVRLLDTANQLLPTNTNAALDFARTSLNFSATSWLIHFLYRYAERDQQGADQLYAQALAVYADKPLREFLYLQAYPFAWRETLNTPFVPNYAVPANFIQNQSLQRRFMEVLLRRAQQAVETPLDERDTYRSATVNLLPGTFHLLQGLIKLEPQVRAALPDLLPPLTEAREKLLVSLSVEHQKLLLQPGREVSTPPVQTFDEKLESALKVSDVDERNGLIATAILASEHERLADVVAAIDNISDSELRAYLTEWLYFHRATAAIKELQFEEAERLTAKVEGREQLAYLHTELAKQLLKRSKTQDHARELLDQAITEAKQAGLSIFAARTLLMVSNLYATLDLSQSIAVLSNAINCINRLESPDFVGDDQALEKTPVRKGRGGRYQGEYEFRFYMPGLDPESAFREMAKIDFDTSLAQSSALTDKFQRALSTLALAEVCLGQPPQRTPKPKSAR